TPSELSPAGGRGLWRDRGDQSLCVEDRGQAPADLGEHHSGRHDGRLNSRGLEAGTGEGRKSPSSDGARSDQSLSLLGEVVRRCRTTDYGHVERVSKIDLTSKIGSVVKRLPVIGGLALRAKRLGHRATQRIRDARKSPYERWMANRLRIRRGLY